MSERTTDGPLHGLHEALGAAFAEAGGRRVPRNYGDPAAEYAAARQSAVVVDRSGRSVVLAHGRDPVRMVDGLATADIGAVTESQGAYTALLSPKGRMVAELRVFRRGDLLVMDTDPAALDGALAQFQKYVAPLFARFEDVTHQRAVLGVYGPEARRAASAALGVELPHDAPEEGCVWVDSGDVPSDDETPGGAVAGATLAARTLYAEVDGWDLFVPVAVAERVWNALRDAGCLPAGHGPLDVLRIEAGRPRWGAELTEDVIPLEAGLRERAINETKGCYTGQEVIVRILHRGHVNRHLRRLQLGDVPAPHTGDELFRADGKAVGLVTSSCFSPEAGQTIGLGYVRREVEPPRVVHLGAPDGPPVRVLELE